VADIVGDKDLANAVALNSTSFNAARTVGPALAGLSIASWGTGWSFVFNGASYFAVLASLFLFRRGDLVQSARARRVRGSLREGFRYIASRSDLRAMMVMLFLVGTLGLNFPIFISTMSVTVFHAGAGRYGLLTSAMAIGTMIGSLLAAGRDHPSMATLTGGAILFGVGLGLAAVMPSFWWFGATLLPVGIAALTFTNSSNTLMQLATEPAMRGRVIAIRLAVMSGVTLIGAPIVGLIADHFGPRYAVSLGALAGLAAAAIGVRHLRSVRAPTVGTVEEPDDDEVHTA
jgi:predicted MFS family arabinose efflux permease